MCCSRSPTPHNAASSHACSLRCSQSCVHQPKCVLFPPYLLILHLSHRIQSSLDTRLLPLLLLISIFLSTCDTPPCQRARIVNRAQVYIGFTRTPTSQYPRCVARSPFKSSVSPLASRFVYFLSHDSVLVLSGSQDTPQRHIQMPDTSLRISSVLMPHIELHKTHRLPFMLLGFNQSFAALDRHVALLAFARPV
jgi:hypothetical protein